jgi:hypothetical protein
MSRLHTSISKNFPPVIKDFDWIPLIICGAKFPLTSQIWVAPDGKHHGLEVREPH